MTTPTIQPGRPIHTADRLQSQNWSYRSLIPRANASTWRVVEGSTVLATLRTVCDRDPDASQALTNLLLFMGRGYETTAYRPGTEVVDEQATAYLRAWDATVGQDYGGGMDAVIDVMNITLISQGAIAVELDIADDLRSVVDVCPVNPGRIVFKRDEESGDLLRGIMAGRGVPGVDREGFLRLSEVQFRYMPLHPWVDDPYGRSLFLAALTAIFFKVQLLTDLQMVVHNQGYPRFDVTIMEEAIKRNAPMALQEPGSEVELAAFVRDVIDEINAAYNALEPDDSFVHQDSVAVAYVGPPSGSVINFETLRHILDTQIIAGLKHLPSFLGRNEGSSTTHATVQLQAFALLVESLQRRTKRIIEWAHTTALNLAGYQASVHVSFESIRASERLTDAQAFSIETNAHVVAVAQGWETDDQAANDLFGHDAIEDADAAPDTATDAQDAKEDTDAED